MSYKYIADSPGGALASSILIGPLGLQGFLINPANPSYGNMGVHQRRLSYAIIVFLTLIVACIVLLRVTATKNDENTVDAKDATLGSIIVLAWSGLGISCFISFIFAIVILSKS